MLDFSKLTTMIQLYNKNKNAVFPVTGFRVDTVFLKDRHNTILVVYRDFLTKDIKDSSRLPRFERHLSENTLTELQNYLDCQIDNGCLIDIDIE